MKKGYFNLYELVDKHTYYSRGEAAWECIDIRLLNVLNRLRENLGASITVNNWKWSKDSKASDYFQWRGLRTSGSKYFSHYSQHSFGRAADFDVKGYTAEEVRKHILENLELYPEIKGIELGVNWVHIDVRNREELLKFGKK